MTIFKRFILIFLFITAGVYAYLTYIIVNEIRPRYLRALEEATHDTAVILSAMVSAESDEDDINTETLEKTMKIVYRRRFKAEIFELIKKKIPVKIYVTDDKGRVLYHSTEPSLIGSDFSLWNDVYLTLRGNYGARSTRTDTDDASTSAAYIAAPIMHNDKITGSLTVIKPKKSLDTFIAAARRQIIVTGIISALVFSLLVILLFIWVNRPIGSLIRYVNRLRSEVDAEQPVTGSPEFDDLAVSFRELVDEIRGRRYFENYIQSLTHELRSPLTAVTTAAELLEDSPSEGTEVPALSKRISRETERMNHIINRLQQLSAIEHLYTDLDYSIFNPADLIREVIHEYREQLSAVNVKTELTENLELRADRSLIRQVLVQLLQNALDFTPVGKTISFSLSSLSGHRIQIKVCNEGEKIPDYALGKIFNRFYSLPRSDGEKSSGLGLTLCREIISMHRGSIELQNTAEGVCAEIKLK